MPEVRLGIPSVVEAALLPRLMGSGRAAWLVLTGEAIDAERAHDWGLVEMVCDEAGLEQGVARVVESLLAGDREALRLQKELLHLWQDGDPAVRPDFALIESLARAPRTLVRMEGLRHLDLTTYGLARARLPDLAEADAAALDTRVQTAAALTSAFLEARVKGRAGAWTAALAHAPRGLLTVRVLPPARAR